MCPERWTDCCPPYVALRDGDGQAAQHDGLALALIADVVPVVMLAIVTIGMVAIFGSVTVPSFPFSLIYNKQNHNENHTGLCPQTQAPHSWKLLLHDNVTAVFSETVGPNQRNPVNNGAGRKQGLPLTVQMPAHSVLPHGVYARGEWRQKKASAKGHVQHQDCLETKPYTKALGSKLRSDDGTL